VISRLEEPALVLRCVDKNQFYGYLIGDKMALEADRGGFPEKGRLFFVFPELALGIISY